MRKLKLPPSQAGYGVGLGDEVLEAALQGGPPRQRRGFKGAVATVNVNWASSLGGHDYLMSFYRLATSNGSMPFLIDLILDRPLPTEYEARFVKGSFQLNDAPGTKRGVSAQLWVRPAPSNDLRDEAVLDAYEAYGENVSTNFRALSIFVNETAPDAIPG